MNIRNLRSLGLAVFIVSFCFLSSGYAKEATKTERTIGKEQEWMENFLVKHILIIKKVGDKVYFKTDREIGVCQEDCDPEIDEFTLAEGGIFLKAPDHHSSGSFTIKEILEDFVIIEYTSQFDHRSFGPNLITIDTGTVKVFFKDDENGE